jgi:hypothetical protein
MQESFMQRTLIVLLALAAFSVTTGCARRGASIPGAAIPFAKADYTVLGNTNAEECGSYILNIDFGHLFNDQSASVGVAAADPFSAVLGLIGGVVGPKETGRALYTALEKIPEATHLLAPRVHTTQSGIWLGPLMIFGQRCATVDARGVVIGDRPIPAAQLQ